MEGGYSRKGWMLTTIKPYYSGCTGENGGTGMANDIKVCDYCGGSGFDPYPNHDTTVRLCPKCDAALEVKSEQKPDIKELERKRRDALACAELAYSTPSSHHHGDNERYCWAVETINKKFDNLIAEQNG